MTDPVVPLLNHRVCACVHPYHISRFLAVAYPGIFFGGGGVQKIQLRTEDREDGDLGAVAPSQGFWRQL